MRPPRCLWFFAHSLGLARGFDCHADAEEQMRAAGFERRPSWPKDGFYCADPEGCNMDAPRLFRAFTSRSAVDIRIARSSSGFWQRAWTGVV